MKNPTEAGVLKACLQLLRLKGIYAWRANTMGTWDAGRGVYRSFRGLRGVADILAILPPYGQLLAIEVKKPGGRVSAHQRAFLARVNELGGHGVVVDDVAELESILRAFHP